jgi:hypothetical protein
MFSTTDLFEEKDLLAVLNFIFSLARSVEANASEWTGPTLGPKQAVAQVIISIYNCSFSAVFHFLSCFS